MKTKSYQRVLKTAQSVLSKSDHYISNMANLSAILMNELHHHWIGFYIVDEVNNCLYLGPFQGPLACTKIAYGKGVCGSSWKESKTFVVDDVHKFPGHIACSSLSNSEIVVPVISNQKVIAVLDIDSTNFNQFDNVDKSYLEELCKLLSEKSF